MTTTISTMFGTFSDQELKTLRSGIEEISTIMTFIESKKEAEKEIINNLFDELKIPKKIIRRLAKTYHKKNFVEETTINNEFEALYEGVEPKS